MAERRSTRSGSEPPLYTVEECQALVAEISKKKRTSQSSLRGATEPPENVSTSSDATEAGSSNQHAGNMENEAQQVWSEVFGRSSEDDIINVIKQFDYVSRKVGEVLDTEEKRKMLEHITNDLTRKQSKFIECTQQSVPEMREGLQELVTNSILKGASVELTELKDAVQQHMDQIQDNVDKINKSASEVAKMRKITERQSSLAKTGVTELLELTTNQLSQQNPSDITSSPGSQNLRLRHLTLKQMTEFLTQAVDKGDIEVPKVRNPDWIPEAVKDKYEEVDQAINELNQATEDEEKAEEEHARLTKGINNDDIENIYRVKKQKYKKILELLALTEDIKAAGNIWVFENKTAPGGTRKTEMEPELVKK